MSSKKENETNKGEKKTPQKRGGKKHTHTIQNKTKHNFRIIITPKPLLYHVRTLYIVSYISPTTHPSQSTHKQIE